MFHPSTACGRLQGNKDKLEFSGSSPTLQTRYGPNSPASRRSKRNADFAARFSIGSGCCDDAIWQGPASHRKQSKQGTLHGKQLGNRIAIQPWQVGTERRPAASPKTACAGGNDLAKAAQSNLWRRSDGVGQWKRTIRINHISDENKDRSGQAS